jgi:hypothetical protein
MHFLINKKRITRKVIKKQYIKSVIPLIMPFSRDKNSLNKYFPNSKPISQIFKLSIAKLNENGFTPENTIFADSTCSDEILHSKKELVNKNMDYWGSDFEMGGLTGLTFAGITGFKAFAHHVPYNIKNNTIKYGNLFILFAPHVGIDDNGNVGFFNRAGQNKSSTCCGALNGAYYKEYVPETNGSLFYKENVSEVFIQKNQTSDIDIEFDYILKIVKEIGPIDVPSQLPEKIRNNIINSELVKKYYKQVEEYLKKIINEANKYPTIHYNKIALLGGININLRGEDYFLKILFEIHDRENNNIIIL